MSDEETLPGSGGVVSNESTVRSASERRHQCREGGEAMARRMSSEEIEDILDQAKNIADADNPYEAQRLHEELRAFLESLTMPQEGER